MRRLRHAINLQASAVMPLCGLFAVSDDFAETGGRFCAVLCGFNFAIAGR
jgi:hypothetical protein